MLDPVLNPVIMPLLKYSPALAILLLSFGITLIVTVIYKYTTNQEKLRELKERTKKLQEELKKLKEKPKLMMKKQKELMELNMEYSRHSMKSTLYTFIPLLFIFGWMNAHLAYYAIAENQEFNVLMEMDTTPLTAPEVKLPANITLVDVKKAGNDVLFTFKGKAGDYRNNPIIFEYKNQTCSVPLIISKHKDDFVYVKGIVQCKRNPYIKRIKVMHEPVRPFGNLSIFGWHPGWLGTYLVSSIVFSMLLRKIMKVY